MSSIPCKGSLLDPSHIWFAPCIWIKIYLLVFIHHLCVVNKSQQLKLCMRSWLYKPLLETPERSAKLGNRWWPFCACCHYRWQCHNCVNVPSTRHVRLQWWQGREQKGENWGGRNGDRDVSQCGGFSGNGVRWILSPLFTTSLSFSDMYQLKRWCRPKNTHWQIEGLWRGKGK